MNGGEDDLELRNVGREGSLSQLLSLSLNFSPSLSTSSLSLSPSQPP